MRIVGMFRRTKNKEQPALPGATAMAEVGFPAPEFSLPATTDSTVSIADFRGQPVVLVFYPADWSPVCGDQLTLYNQVLSLFLAHNAQVLAISVDGIWSHKAFSEARGLQFPLLSDFEPKGAVARAYGVYDTQAGVSKRALFVVDAKGIVQWRFVSPPGVNPGADGILKALESLND
jgi:peroxiredoxin